MNVNRQELLKSFDLLPDIEKREVASEIIRRTLALDPKPKLDDDQLEALYGSFAEDDRELAEQGIGDFLQGLAAEDDK